MSLLHLNELTFAGIPLSFALYDTRVSSLPRLANICSRRSPVSRFPLLLLLRQ